MATAHPTAPPSQPIPVRRPVVLLGSTGSIGTQALDVVRAHPDRFVVTGLAAGGGRPQLLAAQAAEFGVATVAVSAPSAAGAVEAALRAAGSRATVTAGPEAMTDLAGSGGRGTVVLNAVDGSRGLSPTLAALHTGATLALANKESLVAGGPLVTRAATPGQIVPVDSEHSAIAQCLRSGAAREVGRIVLTASGGPFRGRSRAQLAQVSLDDALAHPTWAMGPVVTLNSSTLVNKGLELIEAHLLFGVPYERIDVVVHPQSMVHSMVTFTDGATIAQASPPDMHLPIALALGWPERLAGASPRETFASPSAWTFEPLDATAFPAVDLARAAGSAGGCLPAVFNAANEEAVRAYLAGQGHWLGIVDTVAEVLNAAGGWSRDPASVADVLAAEEWARARAGELLGAARR
ncbi:1-deoxy-D-xylulose-5-phosphate reductoisomerase [Actinomycetospora endophytica]|uniref:1-deoxy-D-xylulose 5-phosphate reductoisomerase n=1 Tax=Actinomycetospora endophytica TaxID=2291215 RepID=A0ABS8PFX0_9PSEU|nr:1-deoxy-D-xylulose-5-phosphate reductoisomerase [Actinomycetospora endophytica]MCD2197144.1 1-deoxy-D-xylulose-5-phosphate reductoisomerase [Actinomycetospora endophytica]